MEDENLKNLSILLSALKNDHLGKEEFTKNLEKVIELVLKIEKRSSEAIDSLERTYQVLLERMNKDHSSNFETLKGQTNQLFVGDKLKEMRKMIDGMVETSMEKMHSKMSEVDDRMSKVKDGYTPQKGKDYFDGVHGNKIKAEEVRNKLESLPKGQKLEISAIENLEEELKKLKKELGRPTGGGIAGNSSGGRIVKSYDLSSSLNGSTRTFSLPSFWRVISVHLSSFPNILRETTDYTTDGSAMTITFTAQVPDASIGTGQTLIVIFSEA